MTNTDLLLKKAIINHARRNKEISQTHYEELISILETKIEEIKLQQKLKEYKEKELAEKYKKLILT